MLPPRSKLFSMIFGDFNVQDEKLDPGNLSPMGPSALSRVFAALFMILVVGYGKGLNGRARLGYGMRRRTRPRLVSATSSYGYSKARPGCNAATRTCVPQAIILLNLLIAIISDTYERIKENEVVEAVRVRARRGSEARRPPMTCCAHADTMLLRHVTAAGCLAAQGADG